MAKKPHLKKLKQIEAETVKCWDHLNRNNFRTAERILSRLARIFTSEDYSLDEIQGISLHLQLILERSLNLLILDCNPIQARRFAVDNLMNLIHVLKLEEASQDYARIVACVSAAAKDLKRCRDSHRQTNEWLKFSESIERIRKILLSSVLDVNLGQDTSIPHSTMRSREYVSLKQVLSCTKPLKKKIKGFQIDASDDIARLLQLIEGKSFYAEEGQQALQEIIEVVQGAGRHLLSNGQLLILKQQTLSLGAKSYSFFQKVGDSPRKTRSSLPDEIDSAPIVK